MSEIKKNSPIRVRVEEINNLGYGVGHTADGRVVFLRGAVTGEEWDAKVIKVAKSYLVARPEALVTPSPMRQETPFCSAPDACGGCIYRHIRYEDERKIKEDYVRTAFRKAGLSHIPVNPLQHAEGETHYRNKAQYPLRAGANGIEAGFYAVKTHSVVTGGECMIQHASVSPIVSFFCKRATEMGLSVYDEQTGNGLLRHLYLRVGEATGEVMVCLVVNGGRFDGDTTLAKELSEEFPAIVSVMLNENRKQTNVILGEKTHCLCGQSYIEDILCGKRFRISPEAFYQVNRDGAELLYGIGAELADLTGKETLIDLYCGIGTIGLSMSDRAERLIGVEIVPEAVECARENARRNGVENAEFYCMDAGGVTTLPVLQSLDGKNTVVVMDPPRKGSTPEVIEFLAERGFPKIVYISCAPDTLARDVAQFLTLGYDCSPVTPVDMFPRTGHVESVVCLKRQIQQ